MLKESICFSNYILERRYLRHLAAEARGPEWLRVRASANQDSSQVADRQPLGFKFRAHVENHFLDIRHLIREHVMDIVQIPRFCPGQERAQFFREDFFRCIDRDQGLPVLTIRIRGLDRPLLQGKDQGFIARNINLQETAANGFFKVA